MSKEIKKKLMPRCAGILGWLFGHKFLMVEKKPPKRDFVSSEEIYEIFQLLNSPYFDGKIDIFKPIKIFLCKRCGEQKENNS